MNPEEIRQLQEKVRKLEDFCFTQNSDFQTKVYNDLMQKFESGNGFGIGKRLASDSASLIELVSLTKGFRFPNMTTTQRDAIINPTPGLVIFNTTTGVLNFVNSSLVWGAV